MKGYSAGFDRETSASARLEGVDASYKDLSEVCGRIRRKESAWALTFLERAAQGEVPVLYRTHNTKLGHRRELGGKQGRYPKKAAGVVLKVLESAIANGMAKSLGENYTIQVATANKRFTYPRMAPKGRTARSYYELARVEIVLKPSSTVPKGAEVKAPAKAGPKTSKPETAKNTPAAAEKKDTNDAPKHEAHPHVHKHDEEKEANAAHAHHVKMEYVHASGKKTEVK